jgi:hypothetical protein
LRPKHPAGGSGVEYFVVRIYRNDDEEQQSYGVVERVNDSRRMSFNNSEELWRILNPEQRDRSVPAEKRIKKNKM